MPFEYPTEIRREACRRLIAGEPISSVASALSVNRATLYRWRKQALVDEGLLAGVKSVESDELARAQRTIRELQAELELVKTASALFNGEEPVSPKGSSRLPEH